MIGADFMNPSLLKGRRRLLRKNPTKAEEFLWERVKNNSLGVKFSRQVGIGRFIVDLCCRSRKLIIEVDGEIHENKEAVGYDEAREEILKSVGYKILRFKNAEVFEETEKVLEKIKNHLIPLPALGEGLGVGEL
jgi:very-short-patch-repair endonuclease